jgi:hypothetical protein
MQAVKFANLSREYHLLGGMRIPFSSVNMHTRVQQNEVMQQPRNKLPILEVVPKQFAQGWRRREENTSNVFRNQTKISPLMNTRFRYLPTD